MPSVVCAVDEAGSEEAVRAAIDFCVEHGADLRLVGLHGSPNGDLKGDESVEFQSDHERFLAA
ncbi:MAG: hypothetical protein M3304_12470, partial [Actinomycetota bacterium]|nr:hypothetical protein [Actinomycetota bacterium]